MSTKDLSNLGRAILNSTLLRPAQTRAWLKPKTHTSSLRASVGAPWEIYRVPGLTQDGRVIDIYTKDGGIGLYASLLVLIPDYDIGATFFSAGDASPLSILTDQVLPTFIPIIEEIGKKQAAARYTGTYDARSSSSSSDNSSASSTSSVEVSIDKGPGLLLKRWMSNDIDVIKAYDTQFGSNLSHSEWRLYPTGLKTKIGKQQTIISYRAVIQLLSNNANATDDTDDNDDGGVGEDKNDGGILIPCLSWAGIDGFVYGSIGVDDFVFRADKSGNVKSIEPRVTRLVLNKRD